MFQNRRSYVLACLTLFLFFLLCFFPATAIPADNTGSSMDTSKNIPPNGFYFDEQSLTLYCNGKAVGSVASAAVQEKFRLHPYAKFLSYEGAEGGTLYYEGETAWQIVWNFSESRIISQHSFRIINPFLAHDENRTYYLGRDRAGPLPNAPYHVFAFFPLAGNPPVETLVVMPDPRYIKSKTSVYYYGQPIEGADPNTFVTLSAGHPSITERVYNLNMEDFEYFEVYNGIAFDNKHVYVGGQLVKEIAAGTNFRLLCRYLVASDSGIYFVSSSLKKIAEADPLSMRMLGTYYSRDKDHVFFNNLIMPADPESFQVIEGYYCRDGKNVFFGGDPIPGADPLTIKVLGRGYAKDKNKVYLSGMVLEKAEPDGFELYPLSAEYRRAFKHQYHITEEDFLFAHDKKRVYFGLKTLDGVNPKGFKPEEYYIQYRETEKKKVDELYRKGKIVY
jgi:hypothetical protein